MLYYSPCILISVVLRRSEDHLESLRGFIKVQLHSLEDDTGKAVRWGLCCCGGPWDEELLSRPAIRHILPQAEGGWEGRFCCPGSAPPCAYQRQKTTRHQPQDTQPHNTITHLTGEENHFFWGHVERCRIIHHLIFPASVNQRGCGEGGGASEPGSCYTSRLFHGKFFGSGGRAKLQLSRPDVFFSLNATNECFLCF